MKHNFPKNIMIYGQKTPIKFIKDLEKYYNRDGQYCTDSKIIELDTALLNNPYLLLKFLHESYHGVWHRLGWHNAKKILKL